MPAGLGRGRKTLSGGLNVLGHALARRIGTLILDGGHDGFVFGLHPPAISVGPSLDHSGLHGQ
jgi:hypothetical protein